MLADFMKKTITGTPVEDAALALYTRFNPNGQDDRDIVEIVKRATTRDSHCIDVGAHRGAILREIVRAAPAGRHIAVEPIPDFAARLTKRFPEVEVLPVALGDETGRATFNYVASNPAFSGLRRRPYPKADEQVQELTVDVMRLDDVVPKDRRISLVKIDVEGGELDVLAGAREFLRRDRPLLIFEHEPDATASYHENAAGQLHRLLSEECGMQVSLLGRWLAGGPPLSAAELSHQVEHGLALNFVAY